MEGKPHLGTQEGVSTGGPPELEESMVNFSWNTDDNLPPLEQS